MVLFNSIALLFQPLLLFYRFNGDTATSEPMEASFEPWMQSGVCSAKKATHNKCLKNNVTILKMPSISYYKDYHIISIAAINYNQHKDNEVTITSSQ